MALTHYIDVVQCLHGKISKKHGKTIFCKRKASGRCYTQLREGRSTAPSSDELAQRNKFKVCVQAAATRLQDPTKVSGDLAKFKAQEKYTTLRGYLAARAFKNYDDSTQTVVWDD